jgi:hypothetical protein
MASQIEAISSIVVKFARRASTVVASHYLARGGHMSFDYYAIFHDLVNRHNELTDKRNEVDLEIAKISQLIKAIFPLLPDDKQKMFQSKIEELEKPDLRLSQAIKKVFKARMGEWLTPPAIRDYMSVIGFSLSGYAGNPLCSIGNTLKRMVPEELETEVLENGRTAYRLRPGPLRSMSLRGIKTEGSEPGDRDSLSC